MVGGFGGLDSFVLDLFGKLSNFELEIFRFPIT